MAVHSKTQSPFLFSLALRGIGTADVEAFSSYIVRLSIAHAVSVRKFLTDTTRWYKDQCPELCSSLNYVTSGDGIAVLGRPNKITSDLTTIIAHATGQTNVRCGTFLAIGPALGRSMQAFSSHLRWCPVCLLELEKADVPYFKLYWQLTAVTHCPMHRLPLTDRCSNCNAHQDGLGTWTALTECCHCSKLLTKFPKRFTSHPQHSWMMHGQDLIELVQVIASDPNLVFPTTGIQRILVDAHDRFWSTPEAKQECGLKTDDDCLFYLRHPEHIAFRSARVIAYRLGLPLSTLLAGNVVASSGSLSLSWMAELPDVLRPTKRHRAHKSHEVLARLRELLHNEQQVTMSLTTVADKVGVSVGYLSYHFPNVVREIASAYKEHVEEFRAEIRLTAREHVRIFFSGKQYISYPKSRKNALRVLRAKTKLPKNLLREEIAAQVRIMEAESAAGLVCDG